jgi:hypothetical protein
MNGSFDVAGKLTSSQSCCVYGDVEIVELEESIGASLNLEIASFEVAISLFRNIKGTASTLVGVCDTGGPVYFEPATIEVLVPYQFSLHSRYSILTSTLGPLSVRLGGELAGSFAKVGIENGQSATTQFDIDDTFSAYTVNYGGFLSLGLESGGFQSRFGLSVMLGGIGEFRVDSPIVAFSMGCGVRF